MAVTRQTLKDVGNFEAKFVGPFTTRQTICLAAGIIPSVFIDYVLYSFTRDVAAFFLVTVVIMAAPIFLGFGSKFCHDMKPEDFVKGYIKYHILAPKIRLYQTKTLDDIIWEEELKKKNKEDDSDKATSKNKKDKKSKTESTYKIGSKTFVTYPHKKSESVRESL